MYKTLIFAVSLLSIVILSAQTTPTIKEKATGIKHTIVDDAMEQEIQRRVAEEVKKITEEEIQKRVDEEVKKIMAKKKPKKVEKKIKKIVKKKKSGTHFKEIEYATALYNKGDHKKSMSILNVLKKDKDKILAEEAHYLLIKWFSNIYLPVIQRSENYNKVLKYKNHTKRFDSFKKAYPKSKRIKDLKKMMEKQINTFNSVNKSKNMNLVDLKDSCSIEYKGDSTYTCTFEKTFNDKKNKKHKLKINISGKITKYDPSGDMQDEWDTSGLLIDDNSLIEITLDGNSKTKYENPIKHKQNPEYELRRVVEYGFSQNKTCVKEHKVENLVNLASYLGDKFIVSNLEVKTFFGKMNELASMDVIYAAKPNGNFFSDRFNSKCYIEFTLDER
ncbi:MAG: hypothetical protein KAS62_12750 [Candidatus Delongbacteria bacterium]|nr:hypothetical protein [Candidatus Delongbacteria bacterium]